MKSEEDKALEKNPPKILSQAESVWTEVKISSESSIEQHERGLIFDKAILKLAEDKLKNAK